jgi:hypothetical protein
MVEQTEEDSRIGQKENVSVRDKIKFANNWAQLIAQAAHCKASGQEFEFKLTIDALIGILFQKERDKVNKTKKYLLNNLPKGQTTILMVYDEVYSYIVDVLKPYLSADMVLLQGGNVERNFDKEIEQEISEYEQKEVKEPDETDGLVEQPPKKPVKPKGYR